MFVIYLKTKNIRAYNPRYALYSCKSKRMPRIISVLTCNKTFFYYWKIIYDTCSVFVKVNN